MARLAGVDEIAYPDAGAAQAQRIRGLVRDYAGLLGGTPSWVRGLRSVEFARRLRAIVSGWTPDIVQLEYPVMGQYLADLPESRAPRVLVDHDLAVEAASERWQHGRGVARLRARAELIAWKRFERGLVERVNAFVVFTDRDAHALRELDAGARVMVVPLGADPRARRLDSVGGSPPTLSSSARSYTRLTWTPQFGSPETSSRGCAMTFRS